VKHATPYPGAPDHRDAIHPPALRDTERRMPVFVDALLEAHLDAVREEWRASATERGGDAPIELKARVRITGRAWAAEEARGNR
jgi:hypothetical protein